MLLNELHALRREHAILKLAPPGLLRESVLEGELLPRARDWKDQAEAFLIELYTLRGAINSINQRYFDGHQTMFPNMVKWFDRVVACVERLIGGFNGDIAILPKRYGFEAWSQEIRIRSIITDHRSGESFGKDRHCRDQPGGISGRHGQGRGVG